MANMKNVSLIASKTRRQARDVEAQLDELRVRIALLERDVEELKVRPVTKT